MLCADLAEAEMAVVYWECSPSPVKEARCAEYLDLVKDLAVELEAILDRNL
jgi:hypothetical protein